MSEIADIITELDRLDREREALMAKLRAVTLAEPVDVDIDPFADPITPGRAMQISGLSRSTVYRLCVENVFDGHNEGFATWRESEERYRISELRFTAYLRRHRPNDTT